MIPININKDHPIGQKVVLIKKVKRGCFMFTVGHEFTVVELFDKYEDQVSYNLMDNENKILVKQVYDDSFTEKVDFKTARDIYIKEKERKKFMIFIDKNCPHKGTDSWDWDVYESCKLIKSKISNNHCKPEMSCINYINLTNPS